MRAGVNFDVLFADVAEDACASAPPEKLVLANSRKKALYARGLAGGNLIVAADTLVYINGVVLGKPADEREAFSMLKTLSGTWHEVYTGVCVIAPGMEPFSFAETTRVYMSALSDEEITRYIETGEPMDKAGAYGIQGAGSLLIERIEGDYFNVVGLPMCRLHTELRKLGCGLI